MTYPSGAISTSPVAAPGSLTFATQTPQSTQVPASGGTITLASGAGSLTGLTLTANSVIHFGLKTASGTITAHPYITALSVSAGTATVAAGGGDNSTYNWWVIG